MTQSVIFVLFGLLVSPGQAQYVGLDFYRHLLDLPNLYPEVKACYISSYDRTGGNDDGFNGTYSALYTDDNGEHVIFNQEGPGCIYNIWFTGSGRSLHWGRIKFYFDGEKTPRISYSPQELFSGQNPPFVFPLVTHAYVSSGGFSSSVPIPFAKHLKITTEKKAGFYNMYYHLYKNKTVSSWTGKEDYNQLIALFESCGSDPKQTGPVEMVSKKVTLAAKTTRSEQTAEIFTLNQAGIIQYIKINPLYAPDPYNLNHMYLKISFDDQSQPAVNVPVGPFFGSGLGEAEVKGLFVGMSSAGSYYCYFPMPFRKSVRVVLENTSRDSGGEFFCDIGYRTGDPFNQVEGGSVGYFGAQYRRSWPITERADYVLFDYKGKGAVVGQVMTVEPVKPDIKRWWEGDMRIFIDAEQIPRFHGTGHEDEYQGGWSNFWLTNPYSLPLFGEPKSTNLINIDGQLNGATTVYRFWPGKIPFEKSIKISTEHGNQNDTPANYSSVVYYYFLR